MKSKMTKTIALLVAALFIFSAVPMGLAAAPQATGPAHRNPYPYDAMEDDAEDDDADDPDSDDLDETEDEDEDDEKGVRATVAQARAQNRQEIVNRLVERKQRIIQAKTNFAQARKGYLDLKTEALGNRQHFLDVVASGAGEEDVLAAAKEYMTATIDATVSYLAAIQEKVRESDLSDENKALIIGNIEGDIEDLEALKEKVSAAQSRSELAQLNGEIRKEMNEMKKRARENLRRLVNHRMDALIDKLERSADAIEAKIERMEDAGVDVTEARDLLEDLRDDIALAQSAETYEDQRDAIGDIQETLKEIFQAMREALQEGLPAAQAAG